MVSESALHDVGSVSPINSVEADAQVNGWENGNKVQRLCSEANVSVLWTQGSRYRSSKWE